jgi:8-oxo-dGTP diphosphatase
MTVEDFKRLLDNNPGLHNPGRKGAKFIHFDPEVAEGLAGSSYVIPFVSDTDCLMTRRSNGSWVLPGGTLEPGETWIQAAHRELMEETGSSLSNIVPIGMFHITSDAERPRLPHIPHPVHVRIVSCADAVKSHTPSEPDGNSTITEVRTVRYDRALDLFSPDDQDFAALYHLAYLVRSSDLT